MTPEEMDQLASKLNPKPQRSDFLQKHGVLILIGVIAFFGRSYFDQFVGSNDQLASLKEDVKVLQEQLRGLVRSMEDIKDSAQDRYTIQDSKKDRVPMKLGKKL